MKIVIGNRGNAIRSENSITNVEYGSACYRLVLYLRLRTSRFVTITTFSAKNILIRAYEQRESYGDSYKTKKRIDITVYFTCTVVTFDRQTNFTRLLLLYAYESRSCVEKRNGAVHNTDRSNYFTLNV